MSHTAQAAPITVQWLVDNFEPAEGCSLRRSSLYNFYKHHCSEQNLEPVNPASFGKLIRSVFLGLRTRRLGTRGNSKYHYYGIRVKATSQLNNMPEDSPPFSYRTHSSGSNSGAVAPVVSKRMKGASHSANVSYYDGPYEQKPQIMSSASATEHWHQAPSSHVHQHHPQTPQQQQQQQQMPPLTTVISSTANHQAAGAISQSGPVATVAAVEAQAQQSVAVGVTGAAVGAAASVVDDMLDRKTMAPAVEPAELIESRAETLPELGSINVKNVINFEHFSIEDLMKFEETYKDHCRVSFWNLRFYGFIFI